MTTTTYSIREAAAASGVTAHTLRWYERIGLLDPVERATDGRRRYSDADLERVCVLVRLRGTGMPVAQVRRYAELVRRGTGNEWERMALLMEHRERVVAALAEQKECLALLDRKIARYDEALSEKENAQ